MKTTALLLLAASVLFTFELTAEAKPPPGARPPPGSKPGPGKGDDYFGGPKAWFQSGNSLGRRDRKDGRPPNPERHKDQFDKITAAEFRRGYMEAYR